MNRIFLTRADLKQRGIMISNSTLLRREAQGEFPKRRYLTPRTVIWDCAEIDEFLASLRVSYADDRKPQTDAG